MAAPFNLMQSGGKQLCYQVFGYRQQAQTPGDGNFNKPVLTRGWVREQVYKILDLERILKQE